MEEHSSSAKSGQEMSEKIAVVSYDAYKTKPNLGSSFLESAMRALFKCLGQLGVNVEAPSNTQVSDQSPDQVDDLPAKTAVDQTSGGVVIVARSTLGTGSGAQIN
ncbi:uncharacterized protein LOC112172400 [Rosa chinensis]|uniref:uncharacterized protein LOC112172400 n=1 Tax=Rosa chinensis TaxID=74649 RepID=UPI000D08DEFF|nr:uncharacterized protein LOC112172400 [Rosa chinensis]